MEKKIEVKDSRLYGLMALYDMHSDFYGKVLEGISDESALNRLDTNANHIAWLAGSIFKSGLNSPVGSEQNCSKNTTNYLRTIKGLRMVSNIHL